MAGSWDGYDSTSRATQIERKASNQMICRKAKCRNALRAGLGFGRYHPTSVAERPSEKPANKGAKQAAGDDRGIALGHRG